MGPIAWSVSLTCIHLPQTQGTCCYKGQTSILWKELCGIWLMTCEQMSLPKPKPSWTGTQAEICHMLLFLTLLLMFANGRWYQDCLRLEKLCWHLSASWVFPHLPEFLHYLQEAFSCEFFFSCEIFYFTTSRTGRRKLSLLPSVTFILSRVISVLSNLALELGLCQYINLFCYGLPDLCLIYA